MVCVQSWEFLVPVVMLVPIAMKDRDVAISGDGN